MLIDSTVSATIHSKSHILEFVFVLIWEVPRFSFIFYSSFSPHPENPGKLRGDAAMCKFPTFGHRFMCFLDKHIDVVGTAVLLNKMGKMDEMACLL